MATIAPSSSPAGGDNIQTKKAGRGGRKGLKSLTPNEANISAGKHKESHEGIAVILSPAKTKPKAKKKSAPSSDVEELMGKFEKLQIEKDKTELLLRERDELLKQRDEEIENREREQEKLQKEVNKLQKLKEFNPTMTIPIVESINKMKKKKDCAEMKKPCPSYVHFCKEHWNEIKKERPELGFKDISNILGGRWKNLRVEERKPYDDKYQQEKEAYLKAAGVEKREKEALKLLEGEQLQKTALELLDQYVHFKQTADRETKKKQKKEKDPLKPKKPMGAFFLFSSERRQSLLSESERKNVVELAKIAGEGWKNMSEELKAPYEEKAKKHKEEYVQQMEGYRKKKAEEGETLQKEEDEKMKIQKQEALQLLKKKEKADNIMKKTKENLQKKKQQKEIDPNKPKKPASSFILFSKETRKGLQQERAEMGSSSLNALVSVKWQELGDEERKKWNGKAADAMAAYKKEMEDYNKSDQAV